MPRSARRTSRNAYRNAVAAGDVRSAYMASLHQLAAGGAVPARLDVSFGREAAGRRARPRVEDQPVVEIQFSGAVPDAGDGDALPSQAAFRDREDRDGGRRSPGSRGGAPREADTAPRERGYESRQAKVARAARQRISEIKGAPMADAVTAGDAGGPRPAEALAPEQQWEPEAQAAPREAGEGRSGFRRRQSLGKPRRRKAPERQVLEPARQKPADAAPSSARGKPRRRSRAGDEELELSSRFAGTRRDRVDAAAADEPAPAVQEALAAADGTGHAMPEGMMSADDHLKMISWAAGGSLSKLPFADGFEDYDPDDGAGVDYDAFEDDDLGELFDMAAEDDLGAFEPAPAPEPPRDDGAAHSPRRRREGHQAKPADMSLFDGELTGESVFAAMERNSAANVATHVPFSVSGPYRDADDIDGAMMASTNYSVGGYAVEDLVKARRFHVVGASLSGGLPPENSVCNIEWNAFTGELRCSTARIRKFGALSQHARDRFGEGVQDRIILLSSSERDGKDRHEEMVRLRPDEDWTELLPPMKVTRGLLDVEFGDLLWTVVIGRESGDVEVLWDCHDDNAGHIATMTTMLQLISSSLNGFVLEPGQDGAGSEMNRSASRRLSRWVRDGRRKADPEARSLGMPLAYTIDAQGKLTGR